MSDILIPAASGGADLDPVTAEAGDVAAGKVIVDKNGNPLTGTLALTGNAAAADVRKGKTFYNTNLKSRLTGTMAEKAAATYTPGRSNQTIAANQYLTGAQTIKGDANLLAKYIKKNVTIFGVTGSFEGYVPTATDLYLRGNNIANWSGGCFAFDTGQITVSINNTNLDRLELRCSKAYNLAGFTKCNIQCKMVFMCAKLHSSNTRFAIMLSQMGDEVYTLGNYGGSSTNMIPHNSYTFNGSFAIPFNKGATATLSLVFHLEIYDASRGMWSDAASNSGYFMKDSAIYRIWLS